MTLTGKKAIRRAFREQHNNKESYEEIGLSWGVSGGVAWKMVKEKYYWPKDPKIKATIWLEASKRGIPLGNRGGRDLWAMSPAELLWRLNNREEYGNHTDTN